MAKSPENLKLLRRILSSFPVGTALLSGAAFLATLWPALRPWLLDLRETPGTWEPWRPFTGHLAHGSPTHLFLDLSIFVPLAFTREKRVGLFRLLLDYSLVGLGVSWGTRCLHDGWTSYCGLSGVIYGFIPLVLLSGRGAQQDSPLKSFRSFRSFRFSLLGVAVVVFLAIKSALELGQNGWLFQNPGLERALGVVYLPGSHCAGILAGLGLTGLYAALSQPSRNRRTTAPGSGASRMAPIIAAPLAPQRRSEAASSAVIPPSA